MAAAAKKHDMPVTFHVRYSSPDEPGKDNATALAEVLQVARDHRRIGARRPHHQHRRHPHDARRASPPSSRPGPTGVDVTACMYAYDFWATTAGSPRFSDGWQERYRITYSDLADPRHGRAAHRVDLRQGPPRQHAGGRLRHPRGRRRHRPADRLDHDRQRRHPRAGEQQPPPLDRMLHPGARPLRARPAGAQPAGRPGQDDDHAGQAASARGCPPCSARAGCRWAPTPTSPIFDPPPWPTRPPSTTRPRWPTGVSFVLVSGPGGQGGRHPAQRRPPRRPDQGRRSDADPSARPQAVSRASAGASGRGAAQRSG